MNRTDTDRYVKQIAHKFFHAAARTFAGQGQGEHQLIEPLRRYRQVK